MKDIMINSYGETTFDISINNEALRSQLGVFLSIRASNGYNDGELEYDTYQGIDYENLLEDLTDEDIILYLKNKIKNYFKNIKETKNFEITRDKSNRTLKIKFEFISVFSNESEVVNIG